MTLTCVVTNSSSTPAGVDTTAGLGVQSSAMTSSFLPSSEEVLVAPAIPGRPRKNSESYGDAETAELSLRYETLRSFSESISANTVPEEDPEETADNSISSLKNGISATSCTPVKEDYLSSLPVAAAIPYGLSLCHSTEEAVIDAVASQVTRIPSKVKEKVRAGMICVKLFKFSKETKLGIRLQRSPNGNLRIGKLAGLVADSPLQTGDDLLWINGQAADSWTPKNALSYLRDSWGWISLTVRTKDGNPMLRQASVLKTNSCDKLGIAFETVSDGALAVQKLNVAGILGEGAAIKAGHIMESINGIPCTDIDNETAISIITNAPRWVNLKVRVPLEIGKAHHEIRLDNLMLPTETVGEDDATFDIAATEVLPQAPSHGIEENAEAAIVSVSLWKKQKADKLGITLTRLGRTLYIQKLTAVASDTILREGMAVIALNDRLASRMSRSEATNYLKNCVGSVRILAKNPHGMPDYVKAMVYRQPSTTTMGVSFKGEAGLQLKVGNVRGLFVDSCLNNGDAVLSINGVSCRNARPREAVQLVKGSRDAVVILAKVHAKAGVVVAKLGNSSRIPA